MLEPGGKGVDHWEGRVQLDAGFVSWRLGNLIYLNKSLCRGGAVVEMEEVLVR